MPNGAGNDPGGAGPGGYAPIGAPGAQQAVIPGRSVIFDPSKRDFAGNDAGYWKAQHWVDQSVVLNLTVQRGKLRSAPTIGVRYREIKRLGSDTQAIVEDMTKEALADLLAAPPKILILSIETEQPVRGQLLIAVSYQNLMTKRVVAVRTNVALGIAA